ncbi:MAG: hypothetical protein K2I88_07135 [Anaeroplasmataceae bacterium]|nr:hypothetical protein [Anaeroplasmataceae bacterium]
MQEEKNTEIVEEIAKDSSLDLARKALRKNVRIGRITKICSITIPILIGIILIGFPIIMHNINVSKNDRYWKEMIDYVSVSYTNLEKTSLSSIEELNKEKHAHFYWLDNMERTESYILTYQGKNVLIEEHYLYEDIECVLYVINTASTIHEIEINSSILNNTFMIETYYINYGFKDDKYYGQFLNEYRYCLTIYSTDTSTIETILSNLRNN